VIGGQILSTIDFHRFNGRMERPWGRAGFGRGEWADGETPGGGGLRLGGMGGRGGVTGPFRVIEFDLVLRVGEVNIEVGI
jgi:hypothetical protein